MRLGHRPCRYLVQLLCRSSVLLTFLGSVACTTFGHEEGSQNGDAKSLQPPTIYANMPLDKALQAGIDFGGDTLTEVKRLVKRRHEGDKAFGLLEAALHVNIITYEHSQLLNAGHLYAAMPPPISVKAFRELIESERALARQLGWQLAAVKPSPALAKIIDGELTRALAENDEELVLIPQMANAVRANHLRTAYTLMRQGLMSKGDEEYAIAMTSLDSERAAVDFLPYLALAPAEELRQLSMSSVNLYTCMTILTHMQHYPPNIGSAGFAHLFDYAVSRNTALAELAQVVIEGYVPAHTDVLAQTLAKAPAWLQIAYLENARRRLNTKEGLLLAELKNTTAESDVVEEINETKF